MWSSRTRTQDTDLLPNCFTCKRKSTTNSKLAQHQRNKKRSKNEKKKQNNLKASAIQFYALEITFYDGVYQQLYRPFTKNVWFNSHRQTYTSHFIYVIEIFVRFSFYMQQHTCMTKLIQFGQPSEWDIRSHGQRTLNSICIICIHEHSIGIVIILQYKLFEHDLSETVFEPSDSHFWNWNAKSHHQILSNAICVVRVIDESTMLAFWWNQCYHFQPAIWPPS